MNVKDLHRKLGVLVKQGNGDSEVMRRGERVLEQFTEDMLCLDESGLTRVKPVLIIEVK